MALHFSENAVFIGAGLTDKESASAVATGMSIVLFSLLGYCSGDEASNAGFPEFNQRFQAFLESEQDRV